MNQEPERCSIRLGIVIEALQREEREHCAKIADTFAFLGGTPEQTAKAIAQAIRRRALPGTGRDWQERSVRSGPHAEKRQRSSA